MRLDHTAADELWGVRVGGGGLGVVLAHGSGEPQSSSGEVETSPTVGGLWLTDAHTSLSPPAEQPLILSCTHRPRSLRGEERLREPVLESWDRGAGGTPREFGLAQPVDAETEAPPRGAANTHAHTHADMHKTTTQTPPAGPTTDTGLFHPERQH